MKRLCTSALLASALAIATFFGGCKPDYPKCKKDSHCKEGEYCVNGLCQQCRDDTDCSTGQQCMGGRCEAVPGYCVSDDDCAAGERCEGQRCVPVPEEPVADTGSHGDECSALSALFFEFDSSNLDEPSRTTLERAAKCIKDGELSQLHLTGHCDPRGTEEYNIALGDQRARAARDYMLSLGVNEAQVTVSSMGEEMASQDESQWSQNRRVEFAE